MTYPKGDTVLGNQEPNSPIEDHPVILVAPSAFLNPPRRFRSSCERALKVGCSRPNTRLLAFRHFGKSESVNANPRSTIRERSKWRDDEITVLLVDLAHPHCVPKAKGTGTYKNRGKPRNLRLSNTGVKDDTQGRPGCGSRKVDARVGRDRLKGGSSNALVCGFPQVRESPKWTKLILSETVNPTQQRREEERKGSGGIGKGEVQRRGGARRGSKTKTA